MVAAFVRHLLARLVALFAVRPDPAGIRLAEHRQQLDADRRRMEALWAEAARHREQLRGLRQQLAEANGAAEGDPRRQDSGRQQLSRAEIRRFYRYLARQFQARPEAVNLHERLQTTFLTVLGTPEA